MSEGKNKSGKTGRPKKETSAFTDIFRTLAGQKTQQELADGIGTTRQNVGRWISGDTTPDINTLIKIAKCFNVSTDYLLGLTKPKTRDDDLRFVCEYTGLNQEALQNTLSLKRFGLISDNGNEAKGADIFKTLNEFLSLERIQYIFLYLSNIRTLSIDYLFLCLVKILYEEDKENFEKNNLAYLCFDENGLDEKISAIKTDIDANTLRAFRKFEGYINNVNHSRQESYFYEADEIKDILSEKFGLTEQQINDKLKDIWNSYDKKGYKEWLQ